MVRLPSDGAVKLVWVCPGERKVVGGLDRDPDPWPGRARDEIVHARYESCHVDRNWLQRLPSSKAWKALDESPGAIGRLCGARDQMLLSLTSEPLRCSKFRLPTLGVSRLLKSWAPRLV